MNNHTTPPTKTCTKCGVEYPAITEHWHKTKSGKYGLSAECKGCFHERVRNKGDYDYQSTPEGAVKTCTACGVEYPATTEYWYKKKRGKYGLQAECKTCISNRDRQYREAHREELRECARQYYEAHRAEKQEYDQQYNEANRGKKREQKRQWALNNADKLREYQQQWKQDNLDRVRANHRNRKARKRNAEGNHTAAEIREQYKRQRGKCYYCGCKLDKNDYHADHVIPVSRGGSNYISNIVCTCPACNMRKHDKLPHEWDGNGGRLL